MYTFLISCIPIQFHYKILTPCVVSCTSDDCGKSEKESSVTLSFWNDIPLIWWWLKLSENNSVI